MNSLPDPGEADSEMTTVHHAVSNEAAKQFLEVQPVEQVRLLLSISTTLSRGCRVGKPFCLKKTRRYKERPAL